ncbi:MAG TPA: hypothetical protein VKH65_15565 [Myxococcales bacterium]|nr:hypothetical protein [Myxococcales bacterium]
MATAIVNKLLHGPTARLRGEQGGPLSDAAAELFGLQDAPDVSGDDAERRSSPEEQPQDASRKPQADVLSLTGRK